VKVAIQCDSPLLQRSLELFLDGHLSSLRQCDILIRDKEIYDDQYLTFVIGLGETSDLIKPFSKAQLLHTLNQKFESQKDTPVSIEEEAPLTYEEGVSFDILERHIDKLTREYQSNILKAIRAFYEK
jgi:HPt (histidine-containing phosphotransfer) domain-containing protein